MHPGHKEGGIVDPDFDEALLRLTQARTLLEAVALASAGVPHRAHPVEWTLAMRGLVECVYAIWRNFITTTRSTRLEQLRMLND
jgi:hypothetical protein